MILDQASKKIEYFNSTGLHYEAVYHYVINRRFDIQEIYTSEFIDDIVAGLISFDMQRMMGDLKYIREGEQSWAIKLMNLLNANKIILQNLRSYNLQNINLDDSTISEGIIKSFNDLSISGPDGLNLIGKKKDRRFPVGASKVLHFLIPDLFIIVDSNARNELSYFYGIKNNRKLDGELYNQIMRLYQDELKRWAHENDDKQFFKLYNVDSSYKRFFGKQKTPLPRIIDKCTFVGSENLLSHSVSYLPKRFEVSIGGFWGQSFGVEIAGDSLIYKTYEQGYNLIDERTITPTAIQWNRFWVPTNKLNIWKWKNRYTNPGIMDGTSWKVNIYYKNMEINSSGSNSFPGVSQNQIRNLFNRFLGAVSNLLGGVSFH